MLWIFLVTISLTINSATAVTCLDDNGNAVDWFVVYKFPKSFQYAFILPKSTSWKKSSHQIHESGMIKNTFDSMYSLDRSEESMYAMYNDEKSEANEVNAWFGHMKGAVAFDSTEAGFWLIHSVPKLSDTVGAYKYPHTGKMYGQHLFCVTLSKEDVKPIIDQLAVSRPWIQDSYVSKEIGKKYPDMIKLINQKKLARADQIIHHFSSANAKVEMVHFSKSVTFNKDLYEDLVAPYLKVSLDVETWQHGTEKQNEPSDCDRKDVAVYNVRHVSFRDLDVEFSNFNDHSKWAVSVSASNSAQKWVCFGDINRQYSQFRRGGGTMCVKSDRIWKAFSSIVTDVEPCKRK